MAFARSLRRDDELSDYKANAAHRYSTWQMERDRDWKFAATFSKKSGGHFHFYRNYRVLAVYTREEVRKRVEHVQHTYYYGEQQKTNMVTDEGLFAFARDHLAIQVMHNHRYAYGLANCHTQVMWEGDSILIVAINDDVDTRWLYYFLDNRTIVTKSKEDEDND